MTDSIWEGRHSFLGTVTQSSLKDCDALTPREFLQLVALPSLDKSSEDLKKLAVISSNDTYAEVIKLLDDVKGEIINCLAESSELVETPTMMNRGDGRILS
ncbi:MAG: hypothetical protein ACOVQX_01015 [Legionella sp.]